MEPLALPDTVLYSGSWLLLPFSERKLAEGKRSRAELSQLREVNHLSLDASSDLDLRRTRLQQPDNLSSFFIPFLPTASIQPLDDQAWPWEAPPGPICSAWCGGSRRRRAPLAGLKTPTGEVASASPGRYLFPTSPPSVRTGPWGFGLQFEWAYSLFPDSGWRGFLRFH